MFTKNLYTGFNWYEPDEDQEIDPEEWDYAQSLIEAAVDYEFNNINNIEE